MSITHIILCAKNHLIRYLSLYHNDNHKEYLFYTVIHDKKHRISPGNVELELVSRILGHASTQTIRIYARPSLEMIREAMDRSNPELNAEKPLWLEDEEEFAKLCGLRIIIM